MAHTTEPQVKAQHWHCGFNQPGYLPESEPEAHGSFEAAQESLAADMDLHAGSEESWAEEHDCDDVPCPTFGDACQEQRAAAIRNERDELLAAVGEEWEAYAADFVYWVRPCDSADCAKELAALGELPARGRLIRA